jgi:tRNA-(ms[2]io[6]A)-hydroxylase
MLRLAADTDPAWVATANTSTELLLLDHAHCEKKAASSAMRIIFRYQHITSLMRPMSELAREELEHFELVLAEMQVRGFEFRRLRPSTYAARLHKAVRPHEPEALLDTLLISALIEARSCERMKLLSENLADAGLAELYRSLLASEARHFSLYVDLAAELYGRTVVDERLAELAEHEAAVIREPESEFRMHS